MTTRRRWSVWKRLLIYPLFLLIAVEVLCLWVVIDETRAPFRMNDGHLDNAPRNAAIILGFVGGVFYLGYAALVGLIRSIVTTERSNPSI